jgi:hypothetical protein
MRRLPGRRGLSRAGKDCLRAQRFDPVAQHLDHGPEMDAAFGYGAIDRVSKFGDAVALALDFLFAKKHDWSPYAARRDGALHYVLFALPTVTSRRIPGMISFKPQAQPVLCSVRLGRDRPHHPCDLVGKRDRRNLSRSPRQQGSEPGPMPWATDFGIADDRKRAGRKQAAQIAITSFADIVLLWPTSERNAQNDVHDLCHRGLMLD